MTAFETPQKTATPQARLRSLVTRAGAMEKIIYASIARAIARKPAIPVGARGLQYHSPVLTILWIFIVLSATISAYSPSAS